MKKWGAILHTPTLGVPSWKPRCGGIHLISQCREGKRQGFLGGLFAGQPTAVVRQPHWNNLPGSGKTSCLKKKRQLVPQEWHPELPFNLYMCAETHTYTYTYTNTTTSAPCRSHRHHLYSTYKALWVPNWKTCLQVTSRALQSQKPCLIWDLI